MQLKNNFDLEKVRADFPILDRKIRGKDLVYLDNAASTQHPKAVIQAISEVYANDYSNIHRGVHFLSSQLTARYEEARKKIAGFIGIEDAAEIILTRGTTESVNLVATAWGKKFISRGDEIVVTRLEHHSNFVPWQALAGAVGAKFTILDITEDGFLSLDALDEALARKPKLLAFTMMSNVLGSLQDVAEIAKRAKASGTTVFVDAAQGIPHSTAKVPDLGPIDFLAFSSHKMCGPSGVGALWGRREVLESMDPYQFGGDMIAEVGDASTTWNELPWKFEAGTPSIVDGIGFAAALDYLTEIGRGAIHDWEMSLAKAALERLGKIPGLKIFGPKTILNRGATISFGIDRIHPHDIASFLDSEGIAIRVGHHCAQPLMRSLGVEGTCRASFYFYNTLEEVDFLGSMLEKSRKIFL